MASSVGLEVQKWAWSCVWKRGFERADLWCIPSGVSGISQANHEGGSEEVGGTREGREEVMSCTEAGTPMRRNS